MSHLSIDDPAFHNKVDQAFRAVLILHGSLTVLLLSMFPDAMDKPPLMQVIYDHIHWFAVSFILLMMVSAWGALYDVKPSTEAFVRGFAAMIGFSALVVRLPFLDEQLTQLARTVLGIA